MVRPDDQEVFKRDGFKCVYCGHDGRTFDGWKFLQVDHFKPRSRGGTDDLSNLVTACIICNNMKGAQEWPTMEEARREVQRWHAEMCDWWMNNVKPLL